MAETKKELTKGEPTKKAEKKQIGEMGTELVNQNTNDGKPLSMEPGETFKGVFLGDGRNFRPDKPVDEQIKTYAFAKVDDPADRLCSKWLIRQHTVLKNTFERIRSEYSGVEGGLYAEITYEGKKTKKDGEEYESYEIYTRAATPDEKTRAAELLPMK